MDTNINYDINFNVYYENDEEYRNCLKNIFKTDNCKNKGSFFLSREIDKVFEKTKTNLTFIKLYEKAANLVFCSNINIGLTILFSYDYFIFFHLCLVEYFHNTENFNENNGKFKLLFEKLQ